MLTQVSNPFHMTYLRSSKDALMRLHEAVLMFLGCQTKQTNKSQR